jgi:membrane-associated protein
MPYRIFTAYNVGGGVLWAVLMTVSGYLFGELPFVEQHFSVVVLGIIAVSLLPALVHALRAWFGRSKTAA